VQQNSSTQYFRIGDVEFPTPEDGRGNSPDSREFPLDPGNSRNQGWAGRLEEQRRTGARATGNSKPIYPVPTP